MKLKKRIKIVLVMLILGVALYVMPLSVELFSPVRPLMPWQQFFMACAARLGQKDSQEMEDMDQVNAATANMPKVEMGDAGEESVSAEMIRVLLSHNQDGNCMFGKMRISCNKPWRVDGQELDASESFSMDGSCITEEYCKVSSDKKNAEFFLEYDGLKRKSTRYRGTLIFYPAADGF